MMSQPSQPLQSVNPDPFQDLATPAKVSLNDTLKIDKCYGSLPSAEELLSLPHRAVTGLAGRIAEFSFKLFQTQPFADGYGPTLEKAVKLIKEFSNGTALDLEVVNELDKELSRVVATCSASASKEVQYTAHPPTYGNSECASTVRWALSCLLDKNNIVPTIRAASKISSELEGEISNVGAEHALVKMIISDHTALAEELNRPLPKDLFKTPVPEAPRRS